MVNYTIKKIGMKVNRQGIKEKKGWGFVQIPSRINQLFTDSNPGPVTLRNDLPRLVHPNVSLCRIEDGTALGIGQIS